MKKAFLFLILSFISASIFATDYRVTKEQFVTALTEDNDNITVKYDVTVNVGGATHLKLMGYFREDKPKLQLVFTSVPSVAFSGLMENIFGSSINGRYEIRVKDGSKIPSSFKSFANFKDGIGETEILLKRPGEKEFINISSKLVSYFDSWNESIPNYVENVEKKSQNDTEEVAKDFDKAEFKYNKYYVPVTISESNPDYETFDQDAVVGYNSYAFEDGEIVSMTNYSEYPLNTDDGQMVMEVTIDYTFSKRGTTKITAF